MFVVSSVICDWVHRTEILVFLTIPTVDRHTDHCGIVWISHFVLVSSTALVEAST